MSAAVMIDFAGPRTRTTLPGALLLLLGLSALAAACIEYQHMTARRAGLELELAAAQRSSVHDPLQAARAARLNEEAAKAARELGIPWTAVLADLERASADSNGNVAVLSVEPDQDKHLVHINGESRDLPLALAYVQRLQSSRSLRYPMLDSHEVVAQDNEHPVRFAMTADWRDSP